MDGGRIQFKDIANVPVNQYSQNADYTSSQVVTITPGFTPTQMYCYAYVRNTTLSPVQIGISNGQAGKISPTAGMCNSMTLNQNGTTKDIGYSLATFDDRICDAAGYSSTVNIKVTSWTKTFQLVLL
jgi:hypothetical protein